MRLPLAVSELKIVAYTRSRRLSDEYTCAAVLSHLL